MRIESLELENMRGFERAVLQFSPGANLIVGANGSGKSTILDAILVALSPLPNEALEVELPAESARPLLTALGKADLLTVYSWSPSQTDLRTGASHLSIRCRSRHGATPLTAVCTLPASPDPALRDWHLEQEQRRRVRLADERPIRPRPVLICADAGRTNAARDTLRLDTFDDPVLPRRAQLLRAMWSGARCDFSSFSRWFRLQEDLENEERVRRRDLGWSSDTLSAVRRAIEGVVPEFSRLRVQRRPLHLVVDKGGQPLFLEQLSDGERTLIAMVADLAHRLAIVHDDLADPLLGEAVMLIDEIELHLHPRLQRLLLPRLQRTFPNVQFIATTHSPQVLASVPAERVQVLDHFEVYRSAPTAGRDSNAILLEVFGIAARPEQQQQQLQEIEEAIDRGQYSEARALLDRFEAIVTERDYDAVRLRSMLSVLDAAQ